MDGVVILSEKVVYESEPSAMAFLIAFGVVMIVLTILAILMWRNGETGIGGMIAYILTAFMLASLAGTASGVAFGCDTDKVAYVEYKVTIDDSVLMNEFQEHYEIIAQEGKIYTVRPKNTELPTN